MTDKPNVSELLELTTEIVAAHAGNNNIAPNDLPQLIQDVYKTLSVVGTQAASPNVRVPPLPSRNRFPPITLFVWRTGKS